MFVAGAVAIMIALSLSNLHKRVIADKERELQNTAFVLAEQMDRAFQALELVQNSLTERMQSLGIASSEELERRMSGHDTHLMLKDKISGLPHVEAVAIANAEGKLINYSRLWPILTVQVSDREYFEALKSNAQLSSFVSDPILNRGNGIWIITLARKFVGPNAEFLGVILGGMELQYFENFFERIALGVDGSIALFRRDGVLLARHPHFDPAIGRSFAPGKLFANVLAQSDSGVSRQFAAIDNQERLIAAATLAHYPVVVTVSYTLAAALADLRTDSRNLIGLAIVLALLIGGIGAVAVQRFREQTIRLDTALNHMHHALLIFDREDRLVVINQRYIEMYGLSPDKAKPSCTLRELLEQRTATGTFDGDIDAYIAEHVAAGDVENKTYDTPDGRTIAITNRRMTAGGWVSTHEDITERQVAEQALAAARREAEHAEQQARAAHARLIAALEVVPEGLVIFDAENRFVVWNQRYAEIFVELGVTPYEGMRFEEFLRAVIARGGRPEANGREEEWVAERLARHAQPHSCMEYRLPNDRWLRIEERRTPDGGSVGVRIDITELKRREASFRLLFENNPIPMWVYDHDTLRFLAVNNAALEHYGYSREQFSAMMILNVGPVEDRDEVRRLAGSRQGDYRAGRTWRHIKADGTQIEVAIFSRSLPYEEQQASIAAIVDITERKRAEDEVRRTRTFLDTVIENIPVSILVKDAHELRYVLINRAAEELLGVPRADMIGKNAPDIYRKTDKDKEDIDALIVSDRQALQTDGPVIFDVHPIVSFSKVARLVTSKKVAIRGQNGEPEYILTVIDDITEKKRAEDRIAYMAHHDPLTDLPNRSAFNEHLAATFERVVASKESFAVLGLDLDRFKEVNDVFGHAIGDALLCEVARRLQAVAVADGAFLARLGGDEFTLIAAEGPHPASAEALAERLQAALAGDIEIQGQQVRIGLSVGVAIFPTDAADAESLLRNADAALYRAKAEGRGTVRFFDRDMDARLRERRSLQHDLRLAVAHGDFILHYQPQAQIGGDVVGFEALVRWRHPTRGMVSPGTFIPLAEESGIIIQIGEWILREACREAASWPRPLNIAVNLSPVQFRHGDLPALVHSILLETGLAAHRLELEITESVLIEDFARVVSILRRLKSLGVHVTMDDFGTGYSSLSYLQSFPFDKIKIDQAFISNADRNAQSATIVRAVIGLGRGLDMPVLAEGVETNGQLAFLSHESCDEIQGYLVGRPSPIADYAELVGRPAAAEVSSVLAG